MNKILILTLLATLAITSCKTKDSLATEKKYFELEQKEPNVGKVIVDIQPDYTSEELAADYSEFEMKAISITSKTLNAWAFSFNADLIKEAELLALLNSNEYVSKAKGITFNNATHNKSENVLRKKTVIAKNKLPQKKGSIKPLKK